MAIIIQSKDDDIAVNSNAFTEEGVVICLEAVPVVNNFTSPSGQVIEITSERTIAETFESVTAGLQGPPGQDSTVPGPPGYTPIKGVDYTDGYTPVKGVDYIDGQDGYTPIKDVDYFDGEAGPPGYTPIKNIDYFDGETGPQGLQGLQGIPGQDSMVPGPPGYTPIKGVDYDDGYTPIKGVDYFDGVPGERGLQGEQGLQGIPGQDSIVPGPPGLDGQDGYTPIKNVDYFDGAPGTPGLNGQDGQNSFTYIGYAANDAGTSFTTIFNPALDYIAFLNTSTEILTPQASDFSGLWKKYKGDDGTSASINSLGTRIVSGGAVTWVTGYTYRVSSTIYYIEDLLLASNESNISLDAPHDTYDRIDIIALGLGSVPVKITGTPSDSPVRPDIDPSLYVMVTFIYVIANTVSDAIGETSIYKEGTEWPTTSSAGTIVIGSLNTPRSGTHSIEGTSVTANTYFTSVASLAFNPALQNILILYINLKTSWAKAKAIQLQWRLGASNNIGTIVTISNGRYGLNTELLNTYQQIVIPMSDFVVPTGATVDRLRFTFTGTGTAIGFFIDDIAMQVGVTNQITEKLALNPKGEWNSNVNYSMNDTVTLNGFCYLCTSGNIDKTPVINTSFWTVLSSPEKYSIAGGFGISFEETVKPSANGVYSIIMPYDITIPANCTGSLFYNKINPSETLTVSIKKNNIQFATISINTSGVATFSCPQTLVLFGDRISLVFPVTQDTFWTGPVITIKGSRLI